MRCRICGAELVPGGRFCGECGASVSVAPVSFPKNRTNKKKAVVGGIAIWFVSTGFLALVGVGAAVGLLFPVAMAVASGVAIYRISLMGQIRNNIPPGNNMIIAQAPNNFVVSKDNIVVASQVPLESKKEVQIDFSQQTQNNKPQKNVIITQTPGDVVALKDNSVVQGQLAVKYKKEAQIDFARIIEDEEKWRREQRGLSPIQEGLRQIDNMGGRDFEQWCASLLKRNGFENVRTTPGSNDQGVDILAEKDEIRYAIQCKCYSSDVGNTPVQEVNAGKDLYKCQIGVVMTNRHFTKGAKQLADATGTLLWDREKLVNMM